MEGIRSKYFFIEQTAYKILNILFSFTVGFLASKASIGNVISPFSLAMLSVTPFTPLSVISLYSGTIIGYLISDLSILNFKFICVSTIMLAVILISGKRTYINKVYSPILSALICLAGGVLFLFADDFSVFMLLVVICESILCGCSSFFIQYFVSAVNKNSKFENKDIISFNITLLIVICALDNFYIYGFSVSLIFTTLLIFMCAYYLKRKIAIAFTLSLCFLISVMHTAYDYYLLILYIPTLVCLAISKFDKKLISLSYYLPYATLVTLNNSTGLNLHLLFAPLISALLFKLTPKEKIRAVLEPYIDIFDTVSSSSPDSDGNKICTDYCESSKALVGKINSVTVSPILNSDIEKKLNRFLHTNDCRDINICNYYNTNGKQILSLSFKCENNVSTHLIKNKISLLSGKAFSISSEEKKNDLYKCEFEQTDIYKVECFALYKAKKGENICGDNVSAFKSNDSIYNLLLADGMGSGKEAYNKSRDAVILLKKLLKSGITPERAVETVNSSIDILKDEIGFSSIDLCSISLSDGTAHFIKCGAYTSFILRNNNLIKVNGGGFPAGLDENISYTKHTVELENNDIIAMFSDGVSNCIDKIQALLLMYNDSNTELLTKKLIDCAYNNTPPELDDDMTVLCAKIIKRNLE